MALVGILSTQLVVEHFVRNFAQRSPEPETPPADGPAPPVSDSQPDAMTLSR